MKKEYLWIGVGSLLCILLVTSVALAIALFPRSTTSITPRSLASVSALSELAEEKETPIQKSDTANSKLQTANFSLSLSSFPSAFFKKDSHLLDGFIIVSPNASDTIREAALELNQKLVPVDIAESDELEIGVDYAGGAQGEWPGVSCKELSTLCIGSQLNLYNRYQYTETLFTPRGRVEYRLDKTNRGANDNVPRPYFVVPQENETYRYKVTFLPALESVNRLTGTGTGGKLKSSTYPDIELGLWGKEYILIDSSHPRRFHVELTIVGGIKDVLAEGQERTYEIEGDTITIKAFFINENNVQFEVNGERIKPMADDETRVIPEAKNRSIAVHEILENEGPEEDGLDRVEFYFGDLIQLIDTNTTSPSRINEKGEFEGSTVVWNNEQLPQIDVSIVTTRDDGLADFAKVTTKSIEFMYRASDDIYGWGKMSKQAEKAELGKKGNFLNLFEIEYAGIDALADVREKQKTSEYVFHPHGEDAYALKWQNNNKDWYDFDVVSCADEACTNISYGKKSGNSFFDLIVNESETINENEYFFLQVIKDSYLMTYDNLDTVDNVLTIREVLLDHENERPPTYEISYDNATGIGFFDHGKSTFTFNVTNETTGAVVVDMNGDGDFSDTGMTLRASSGGDVNFSAALEPRIQYQTNELFEDVRRDAIDFRPYFDSQKKHLDINVSDISGTWLFGFNSSLSTVIVNRTLEINNTDVSTGMTEFGLRAELTAADDQNQSTFTIFAPKYQLFGFLKVYPTLFKKLVKKGTGGGAGSAAEKGNLIIIGGPCENPVTAEIVGFGTTETECALGAKKGEAVIRLYSRPDGSDALVVAGADEESTLAAIEVLKEPEKYLKDVAKDRVIVMRENGKIILK